MKQIPNIYLTKFIFNLVALQDMQLPKFKGSKIEGAFGWEFKDAVGPLEPIYEFVFNSPAPDDLPKELIGVTNVPHPLIIHPPLFSKQKLNKGEIFNIGLTVIGNSANFTPFFVETIRKMGEHGLTNRKYKFRLINVYNITADNSKILLYEDHNGILKVNFSRITSEQIIRKINYNLKKIKLQFKTPFVIQTNNKEITKKEEAYKITPGLIIENFERRIRHLAWLYCNSKLEKEIYDTSQIRVSDRDLDEFYLTRKKKNNDNVKTDGKNVDYFYGLTGNITLEGELMPVLPLIYIGEKINFGKKTSFGFGEFRIMAN